MIKVAVFEDHPIVLKSLKEILVEDQNFEFVFGVSSKTGLYENIAIFGALDVLILDFFAIDVRGMELYDYVHKNYPKIKMISFTSLSSPILIENLLASGVKGYVNKSQDIEDLLQAINEVYDGKIYLPEDYKFLAHKLQTLQKNNLTEREIEIVSLIAKEFTSADIAKQYGLSLYTIENHRKNIFSKLNVKNVAGLVREALSLGYLEK